MTSFLNRFASSIYGVLSGFDRIRFRGTQRLLASTRGLQAFLSHAGVLLKDFKPYVTTITDRIEGKRRRRLSKPGWRSNT